jgi:hypothetical protein
LQLGVQVAQRESLRDLTPELFTGPAILQVGRKPLVNFFIKVSAVFRL